MLTVLTWLWAQPGGRATYTAQHVNIWADMVRRNLGLPHRIACVTDIPAGLASGIDVIAPPRDFEDVRIPSWGEHRPQCLRRIAMFAPDAGQRFGERFVCMDLDTIITGAIDRILDRPEDFVMCPGSARGRPYNGSMMLLTAGARARVYEQFTPAAAAAAGERFVGSDQAWISAILGSGEATFNRGVSFYGPRFQDPTPIVFFPGTSKPWDLIAQGGHGWAETNYRRGPSGRCLILGYAPSLWRDVEAALQTGPFGAVIASPEAAAHWPHPVDAIAKNDGHALRLARMLGFETYEFCGAQAQEAA